MIACVAVLVLGGIVVVAIELLIGSHVGFHDGNYEDGAYTSPGLLYGPKDKKQ